LGRIPKCRRIVYIPEVTYFKPVGTSLCILDGVRLLVGEVEAIRRKDLGGLRPEECAHRISISRPTFHPVLGSVRSKLADTLLNGKVIRIEGSNFDIAIHHFCCINGHQWE
jgi:predicted DNA-binding protein (UPF0251 family)